MENEPQPAGNSSEPPLDQPVEDPEVMKKRITELEERLATLEKELDQAHPIPGVTHDPLFDWRSEFITNLRKNWKAFVFLLAVIVLAALPGILVVRDRWLNLPNLPVFTNENWCKSEFLCYTGLPAYFASIFAVTLLIIVLILVTRDKGQTEASQEFQTTALPEHSSISSRQQKTGKILVALGVCLVLSFFILGLATGMFLGLGFLLAILLYVAGWLALEVSWPAAWQFLVHRWDVISALLLFETVVVLFLAAMNGQRPFTWGYLVLLILAALLMRSIYRKIPPIAWVFNLALVLYSLYANRWSFATIGDEYAFFNTALEIAVKHDLWTILNNLFDGSTVYGTHPYLSSLLQALSMKFIGLDSFGWRFSNFFLSALATVFFYLFFKRFTSRSTGLLAAIWLAASVYLMTFGKIGYNNLQALFALSLTLSAMGWAVQRRTNLAYTAAGLSMGLCFYVYPAALYIVPLPLLLQLFYNPPKNRQALKAWAITAAALVFCLLPLFVQPEYWQTKGMGLIFNNPEIVQSARSVSLHIFSNLVDAFYSFLYTPQEAHLVPVAYTDPLSAGLILIGMALVFKRSPQRRFLVYMLLGFFFLLIAAGVSHDRRFPPTTRMFLLLPWFAFFAVTGLEWLADQVLSLKLVRWSRNGFLAVMMTSIVILNLYLAYNLSLVRNNSNQTAEALFLRTVQNLQDFEPVRANPVTFLFLTNDQWGIDGLHTLLKAYAYPASSLSIQREAMDVPVIPEALEPKILQRETVVVIQPDLSEEWKAAIGAQLLALGKEACDVKEYTGRDTRFQMWLSPDLKALCQSP
jgi:4-amino-4-deoxy-L-arabinose transferase-like glycosyltransferase